MGREDIIKFLTSIQGIGKAKAEAIIKAGFDSIEKLKEADVKELSGIKGIGEELAKKIKEEAEKQLLRPGGAEAVKKEEKVGEKKTEEKAEKKAEEKPEEGAAEEEKAEEKEEKPEEKKGEVAEEVKEEAEEKEVRKEKVEEPEKKKVKPKIKPKLTSELKDALEKRKIRKEKEPTFRRQEWFRYKRLGECWRRPKGLHSKMRKGLKYRPPRVKIGYRGPKLARNLHPSGFEEVMVYRVEDLEKINPERQAARIGGTVGTRKRIEIVKRADELGIRVLNRGEL